MYQVFFAIAAAAASPLIDDEHCPRALQRERFDSVVRVWQPKHSNGSGVFVWCREIGTDAGQQQFEAFVATAYHCVDVDADIVVQRADASSTDRYSEQFSAEIVALDKLADVAILRVRTDHPVPCSPVISPSLVPEPPIMAISIGCSHGEYPTIQSEKILGRKPYPKLAGSLWFTKRERAGGRSGAPLISLDRSAYGYILGVYVRHRDGKRYYSDTGALHDCMRRAGIPIAVRHGPKPLLFLEFEFFLIVVKTIGMTYLGMRPRL